MQEQEDIHFDTMPAFGGLFASDNRQNEKEYNSLYDELEDKCRPSIYI